LKPLHLRARSFHTFESLDLDFLQYIREERAA
jgi:hypothetical protein